MTYAMLARRDSATPAMPRRSISQPPGALRIGKANDTSEQEANQVAGEVMRGTTAKRHWSLAGAGGPAFAPPIVHDVLSSPGRPLDAATRDFFEPRLGHDLGGVRLHSDERAAASAQAVEARAYTVGQHVVLGGEQLHTPDGRKLLAHELTHTLQQGSSPVLQRQPLPGKLPEVDLTGSASPLLAAAIGSVTLDGFVTGKADVAGPNQAKLDTTARTILKLLNQYPASKIRVIGYTDAVGQESNNQALGQARADSVQAALLALGIPEAAIRTESRGANDLAIQTTRAEPRNRRVQVRFEPSTLLRGAMTPHLTLSPGSTQPAQPPASSGGIPGIGDLCARDPALCYGPGGGAGKPSVPPDALKPIPDNTPFNLMDVSGINEPYISHGRSPQEGGDLRQTWASLYWKYRNLGLSEKLAAKAANSELSSTAGKDQSRDNPNAVDRLNSDMNRAYPNATTVGPASVTLFRF